MSTIPANLQYTTDHEWVRLDGNIAVIGVTAYAAEALGDVVYLGLPAVGEHITAGQACGEIESTKSVSDLLAPADGEILEVNEAAVNNPDVVNSDPYGAGWLVKLQVTGDLELLDSRQYAALVGEDES